MKKIEQYYSYEDFVTAIAQGNATFEVKKKMDFAKLFFNSSIILLMRVLLALIILPIIAVPVVSYMFDNWLMLLGFLGLFFGLIMHGIQVSMGNPLKSFIKTTVTFGVLAVVLVYFLGILQTFAFIYVCFTYEFFFLGLSDMLYDDIAKNNLIKDPDRYYFAIEHKIVQTQIIYDY